MKANLLKIVFTRNKEMAMDEKTVPMSRYERNSLWLRIVAWSIIGTIAVVIPPIFIYRIMKNQEIGFIAILAILVFLIALPILFIYVSFGTVIDLLKDLRGNVKQIVNATVENKVVTSAKGLGSKASCWITANERKYNISADKIRHNIEIGDEVQLHLAPVSKILLEIKKG